MKNGKRETVNGKRKMKNGKWYFIYYLPSTFLRLFFLTTFLLPSTIYLLTPFYLYSYTSRGSSYFGDVIVGYTARSAAMGGVSIVNVNDGTAIFTNPAGIPQEKFGVLITPSIGSPYEVRRHNDADATKLENYSFFFEPSSFASYYGVMKNMVGVAIAGVELTDLNYKYEENILNSAGKLTDKKIIGRVGRIFGLGGGASFDTKKGFIFGVSGFGVLGGNISDRAEIDYNPLTGAATSFIASSVRSSFSGFDYSLGMLAKPSKKITLGATFRGPFTLKDSVANVEYKLPSAIGFGGSIKFKGPTTPLFVAEFVYTFWGGSKSISQAGTKTSLNFSDTFSWYLGAEHLITKTVPLRYGFYYLPDYSRKGVQTNTVCLGSGFKVYMIEFDLSAQYIMRRTTLDPRQFTVASDTNYPYINKDTVDDYVKRFIFTIKYRW